MTGAMAIARDRRSAFAELVAVSLMPLLVVGLPPLVDLYGHLGRYAVQTELAGAPNCRRSTATSGNWSAISASI